MEEQNTQFEQGHSGADRQQRRYRKFDEEFKREAVRLSELPGKTLASVARSLGIDVNTLGMWRKKFGTGAKNSAARSASEIPQGSEAAEAALVRTQLELMELRKRLREAEMERDILKKAMGVVTRPQP